MTESIQEHVGDMIPKQRMIDLEKATIIDLTCDETGKVWVNVDGKCLVRIGKVQHVSLYGFNLTGAKEPSFHKSFVPGEATLTAEFDERSGGVESEGYSG